MIAEDRLRSFTVELYKINAIKFGEFKTKVGLMTPVYCDFRVIISYPELLVRNWQLILSSTRLRFQKRQYIICIYKNIH